MPRFGTRPLSENFIDLAYMEILHRNPKPSELRVLASEKDLLLTLIMSKEWRKKHKDAHLEDDEEFIKWAYREILHREPDFSGFLHYKRKLKSTSFDKGDLLLELIKSPEYKTRRILRRAEDIVTFGVPWNVRVAIIIATPSITRYKFRKTYENLRRHTHGQYQLIVVETHFDEEIYCHPRDMNIAPKGTDADFYVFMNDDIDVKPG